MSATRKDTTLAIDKRTSEILDYLAKITRRTKASLIREIFDQIISIAVSQKEGTIIRYESSVLNRSVTITFEGPSRLIFKKTEIRE